MAQRNADRSGYVRLIVLALGEPINDLNFLHLDETPEFITVDGAHHGSNLLLESRDRCVEAAASKMNQ